MAVTLLSTVAHIYVLKPGDNYVSVLPLPWIMEQVYAVGQALIARQIVNFVEGQETLMADLREIGPNFVLLAPRVWEGILADVKARMMDSTPLKQKLFDYAFAISEKPVCIQPSITSSS